MKRAMLTLPMLGISLVAAGCCNTRQPPPPPPAKLIYVQPGTPVGVGPPPPPGFGPPAAFPTTPPPPPPASFGPPGGVPTAPPPGAQVVPSISPLPGPGSSSNRIETEWQAAEGREPAPTKPRIMLYAPEQIDQTDAGREPPLAKKPSVQASFPSIPQFAVARDNVYTGTRPPLPGLDWLATNGVQTVVHVRLGNTDDASDRMQVEQRKMQYVSFTVTPQTLTKEKADEFIKLIRDNARQGIFVYDEDGSLAGALWYLNFRWGEFLDVDAAQLRARDLGLRIGADGQHRTMWVAVQKLLSENNR